MRIGANSAVDRALMVLTAHGSPITDQRRLLVAAIASRSGVFTADDVLRDPSVLAATIGRATVFRTLDLMTRLELLGRVADGERSLYTVCDATHHFHLVCTSCGRVLHIDDCPVDAVLADLQARTGFTISHHRLELAGLCPACQSASSQSAPSDRASTGDAGC